jgi:hypothetical protein
VVVPVGWRTEARESLDRCIRQAEEARADAQEARALADSLPAGTDRDDIMHAARDMDHAADLFLETANDIRRALDRARGY